MDNATRKIWSASSLGVFLREAPSTMAIILSMKPSPGLLLISTTIQSDMTVVPPVTALLSPPLSRITGADSPVIALSSTEAAPSITSPSAGICSPAFIYTISPFFSSVDLTCVILSFWPGDGRHGIPSAGPQRICLGLAPAFCDCLGKVAEQYGEPEDD